jgi:hypothetical protein
MFEFLRFLANPVFVIAWYAVGLLGAAWVLYDTLPANAWPTTAGLSGDTTPTHGSRCTSRSMTGFHSIPHRHDRAGKPNSPASGRHVLRMSRALILTKPNPPRQQPADSSTTPGTNTTSAQSRNPTVSRSELVSGEEQSTNPSAPDRDDLIAGHREQEDPRRHFRTRTITSTTERFGDWWKSVRWVVTDSGNRPRSTHCTSQCCGTRTWYVSFRSSQTGIRDASAPVAATHGIANQRHDSSVRTVGGASESGVSRTERRRDCPVVPRRSRDVRDRRPGPSGRRNL